MEPDDFARPGPGSHTLHHPKQFREWTSVFRVQGGFGVQGLGWFRGSGLRWFRWFRGLGLYYRCRGFRLEGLGDLGVQDLNGFGFRL